MTSTTAEAATSGGGVAPVAAPATASTVEPTPTIRPRKRKLAVPTSIDASGATDVSSKLQAFINDAPNGSTIRLRAGGTYRLGEVLRLRGKQRITIDGNGATLKLSGSGFTSTAIFVEQRSDDVVIRDVTIAGNHAAAGTSAACCDGEGQHGIAVWGSTDVLIERVDVSRVGGDCFNVNAHDKTVWSKRVTIRDSVCQLTGRMGVHINAGADVRIVDNVFDQIGYAVIASEPNQNDLGATDVVIRGNDIGSYSLTSNYKGYLFYACDAPWSNGGAVVRDVTVTGNTVAGNRAGKDNSMMGLRTLICDEVNASNIVVTNNTAGKPVDGPVMRINDVTGVTVTGNTQPLSSGQLATFPGSSNVTYRDNDS